MDTISYYIRDVWDGIGRNKGAAAAAAALIFIALTLSGVLFIGKIAAGSLMAYLESQVNVKIYVDRSVDAKEIIRILQQNSFVQSAETETKEQLLDKLAVFFQGREHLLDAFKESAIPDAVRVTLTDSSAAPRIAEELRTVKGIVEIVYPQQFAETLMKWSGHFKRYGLVLLVFFTAVAFLTVYIGIHLAVHQRQKEIRVKLLLGAKPLHVRGQFLFEAALTGITGSLLSAIAVFLLYTYMLFPLLEQFPFIFHFPPGMLYATLAGIIAAGPAVSLPAAYFAARKLTGYA